MADELAQLKKLREQSRKRLAVGATFGLIGSLGVMLARVLVLPTLPVWLAACAVALLWLQFVGDVINIRHLSRKIADATES